MPWDPIQYEKFQSERSAPFYDLMELVEVKERMNCIDLGCGTGQLTRVLADRLPSCKMLGIDSSSSMLEDSEKFAGNGLAFDQRSIEDLDSQWDLVFSNAAIQWVPSHEELIPKLLSHVRTGRTACSSATFKSYASCTFVYSRTGTIHAISRSS